MADGYGTAREEYDAFMEEEGNGFGMVPYTDENAERMASIRERARVEGLCMKSGSHDGAWEGCMFPPERGSCGGCPVL